MARRVLAPGAPSHPVGLLEVGGAGAPAPTLRGAAVWAEVAFVQGPPGGSSGAFSEVARPPACLLLTGVMNKCIPCMLGMSIVSFNLKHRFESYQWISVLNMKEI